MDRELAELHRGARRERAALVPDPEPAEPVRPPVDCPRCGRRAFIVDGGRHHCPNGHDWGIDR